MGSRESIWKKGEEHGEILACRRLPVIRNNFVVIDGAIKRAMKMICVIIGGVGRM